MVKLVTKSALNSDLLPGVSWLFDKESSYFYDRNNDSFKVAQNAEKQGPILTVRGDGFNYIFSQPTRDGTVEKLVVRQDGDQFYKITGLDIGLGKLLDSNFEKALKALFKGNDTLKGSSGIDVLNGHSGKDKLFGKDGNDTLYGKKGDDILDGGKGSDRLDGGGGLDTYVFKIAPDASSYDTIVKFRVGETIELGRKAFPALSKGPLPADQFFIVGEGTKDDNDHIIFDRASGNLFYDPDGTGSAPAVRFAAIQANYQKLGADDFLVV